MIDVAFVVRNARWHAEVMDNVMRGGLNDRRYRALQRDDFECAGCGCRSSTVPEDIWCGLEVHHLDDNAANNDLENLITVCPLCHGLLHMDLMLRSGAMPGRFLWLENVPQSFLNMLTHVTAVLEIYLQEGEDVAGSGREGHLALAMRERCRDFTRRLNECGLPRGVLMTPAGLDAAQLLERRPDRFGDVVGAFLRASPSRAQRERLASALQPLRWFYDWRGDEKARCYASSTLWGENGAWPVVWSGSGFFMEKMCLELDEQEGVTRDH